MLTKDKADKLIEIFVIADDFYNEFHSWIKNHPQDNFRPPRFEGSMSPSEVLSIIIFYHFSGYKCFKYYYQDMVQEELWDYFPDQVGYKRFLQLITKSLPLLFVFLKWRCLCAEKTGIYFIDSKKLQSCHNRRIHNHKVFKDIAQRGHTSTGWFYGLKLHLVVNNLVS